MKQRLVLKSSWFNLAYLIAFLTALLWFLLPHHYIHAKIFFAPFFIYLLFSLFYERTEISDDMVLRSRPFIGYKRRILIEEITKIEYANSTFSSWERLSMRIFYIKGKKNKKRGMNVPLFDTEILVNTLSIFSKRKEINIVTKDAFIKKILDTTLKK